MNEKFTDTISNFKSIALQWNLILVGQKEIPYGIQLEYSWQDETSKINIYFSEKKDRISFTVPKKDTLLNYYLNEAVIQVQKKNSSPNITDLHNWKNWIGSDESGKGDYFGPLVVAAFYCKYQDITVLQNLGVKDSKQLQDPQINIMAQKIMERFPNQYQLITLIPKKYNELYNNFTQNKKNLNHLLSWCHSKVIANLARKFNPEGIFVDRFTNQGIVEYYLNSEKIDSCDIIQAHQGERDIAVATASILARAKFNAGIDYFSKQIGIAIPKGGGANTITAGKQIVKKLGQTALEELAKLHFKNTQKII
ncbi:ribonuclease HIII [bacterium]|nr:ribonuclease HIII [bacterium]